ncbi:glycohydrolase toxin TNT-related protein [Actinosynnema sp. NPDC059797]
MSELKPLNPTEQDALVKQIGLTLMRAAPEEWRHVTAEYRATGRYSELTAEVRSTDGNLRAWSPPQEVANLFARLRAGMYREGRGSWSNARYQLDHPSSYNLDFDRNEPSWQTPPPPQAYLDEMRFFPRTDENVPDWLRRRLQQAPPPPPRAFRTARVFDGAGPGGRPSVNRPPVADDDRDLLLSYLDRAPVAVVGRGFDADVLNPDAPQVVPVAFQTDGHWIWPAAVGYYLRAYGVPPEPELVERAKAQDFVLPEVTEEARVAAAANLGAPAAPQGTALPVAEPPEPAEVGATVVAALPELPTEPGGRAGGEEAADRADAKSEPIEYGQEGPPYRVRFEEDGPVIDDRYRRESYVEGMDLFAPAQYERESGDTQAWSPFSEEEPEPVRTGKAAEVEAAPAESPARESSVREAPVHESSVRESSVRESSVREDPADEPVAEAPAPAPDEVTAEFEVDQELYDRGRAEHDDEPFDEPGAPPADRRDFDERAEEQPGRFAETSPAPHAEQDADRFATQEVERFTDDRFAEPEPDRFAAQEADEFADQSRDRFPDEPDRFAAQEQDRFADQAPDPSPGQFTTQEPPFADREQQDRFAAQDSDRFAVPAPEQFTSQDSDRFATPAPDQFAAQEPDRFATEAPDQFADRERDRFAAQDSDRFAVPTPDQFAPQPPDQFAAPSPDQFTAQPADQFTAQSPDRSDRSDRPDRFAEVGPASGPTPAPAPASAPPPPPSSPPAQPFREATPTPPPPPPAVVEPRQVTPEEERELAGIRRALDELDVPPAAYRFGGEPADRTWLLRTEGQDWEVSWFDHGPTNPVRFDRVEDAAAYLVGKLVLTHRRAPRPNPLPPPPPPMPPQQRPRPPMNNGFREEPPRRPGPPVPRPQVEPPAQPAAAQQPEGKPTRSWPINPMNGEPPLTLFRHKKMVELPAGVEVDRFGDGTGNLVYAAGTPFPQRSLVPSWVNRPYRVYRLRRPVEVLTGVAVPWFEQPGGGTAYLLPKAVDDMIADGVLVEVANQEAPLH